jgi:hypothetical protein
VTEYALFDELTQRDYAAGVRLMTRLLIVLALPFVAFSWLGQHVARAFTRECGEPRLLDGLRTAASCWTSPVDTAVFSVGLLVLLAAIYAALSGPAPGRP